MKSVCISLLVPGVVALQTLTSHSSVASTALGSDEQNAVWVTSYPRSGSSTLLSMMVAPLKGEDPQVPKETFALFEPCHDGDEYEQDGKIIAQDASNRKCNELLPRLMKCDYSTVGTKMWGWWEAHTTSKHQPFSSEEAERSCKATKNVVVKTVDWGHDLSEWTWMLDAQPNLKIVDVVRDPRGIYASWKELEPFATLVKEGSFYTLTGICETYAKNIDLDHPRVKKVVFENLVKAPSDVTRDVYAFLGRDFEDRQAKWVLENFDAIDCPSPPPGAIAFRDCHTESRQKTEQWRQILTEKELEEFDNSAACQRTAAFYGFAK